MLYKLDVVNGGLVFVRWALGQGCGAYLIKHPELVTDMVEQARSRTNLPVSIKIRTCDDIK